jgi:Subtilase family/Bacterial TSP3 repeat
LNRMASTQATRTFHLVVLLSCLVVLTPTMAATTATPPGNQGAIGTLDLRVMQAFQGSSLRGKNGPLHRLGADLISALLEYEDFQVANRAQAVPPVFHPSNRMLRSRNNTVVIDAVADGDPQVLLRQLVGLGLQQPAVFNHLVSGRLPITALRKAAALGGLTQMRPAYASTRTGSVTSQGDTAMHAASARATFGTDGSGILVGTLSDSYNCLGGAVADVASNDLPSGVLVLQDETGCSSGTDEGRAMMQIVHDIAPGSSLAFHSAFNGTANFANGILDLASAGATVINDDVIYYAEPMFQDGAIAQAVDTVKAAGVAYFSAAGNDARNSYTAPFSNSGAAGHFSGSVRHDFDSSGATDTLQQITVAGNSSAVIVLQWQDCYASISGTPGAASDLDLIVYDNNGGYLSGSSSFTNNLGNDPVEIASINNTGNANPKTYQLGIEHYAGEFPALVKLIYFGNVTIDEYNTHSSTIYGHPNAAGGLAVGAARYSQTPAYGTSPPLLEPFSSTGGTPILFDSAGNPVSIVRQKPEIVAPDGGDTTFFGFDYEGNGHPNFFGTSAATPHAAGVAALLRAFDPALTPDNVYNTLQNTAIDMGTAGVDFDSGHGLVQADAALASLDNDADGVPDSTDLCPGTAPGDPVDANGCSTTQLDADGDGVPDTTDQCPDTAPGDPVDGNGCSDFQKDSDGDGLSDGLENQLGTNPLLADTDGDGLSDYQEVDWDGNPAAYTPGADLDPLAADTDLDGFNDGMEVTAGYDPLSDTSFPVRGDINNDRVVDAADILLAVRAIEGLITLDSAELARGKVAPLVDGVPQPQPGDPFNIADLLLILRKVDDSSLF